MTRSAPLLLFDLDGTLIDSAPDLAGAANDLRARHGLPPKRLIEPPVHLVTDRLPVSQSVLDERNFVTREDVQIRPAGLRKLIESRKIKTHITPMPQGRGERVRIADEQTIRLAG